MNINNFPSIEQMTNQIGSNQAVKAPMPPIGNSQVSFEEIIESTQQRNKKMRVCQNDGAEKVPPPSLLELEG